MGRLGQRVTDAIGYGEAAWAAIQHHHQIATRARKATAQRQGAQLLRAEQLSRLQGQAFSGIRRTGWEFLRGETGLAAVEHFT